MSPTLQTDAELARELTELKAWLAVLRPPAESLVAIVLTAALACGGTTALLMVGMLVVKVWP